MKIHLVYITTKDKAEARRIGRHLVETKLVACVNIIDHVNSMYFWNGEFQDNQEAVIIAKTNQERLSDLIDTVKARHSYECPCVVTIPLSDGNPDFLKWVENQIAF